MTTKSGYVAFLGAPNAGKSTLLNKILGEKIAIVTHKAQTTRKKLSGVHTLGQTQIVFLDVPGIHESPKQLNQVMMSEVMSAVSEADILIWLFDATLKTNAAVMSLYEGLSSKEKKKPQMILWTKRDLLEGPLSIAPSKKGPIVGKEYLISAQTGEGISEWLTDLATMIPDGPFYFDQDQITDTHLRDMAAEIVREKCLIHLHDEIPYSMAVVIDSFKETPEITRIQAILVVEQESQKGIVIGAGGQTIKRIGTAARLDLEKLMQTKIFLGLKVKVDKGWTKDTRKLAKYGYQSDKK